MGGLIHGWSVRRGAISGKRYQEDKGLACSSIFITLVSAGILVSVVNTLTVKDENCTDRLTKFSNRGNFTEWYSLMIPLSI